MYFNVVILIGGAPMNQFRAVHLSRLEVIIREYSERAQGTPQFIITRHQDD